MRNRTEMQEDFRLAKSIDHDEAIKQAAARMGLPPGAGVDKAVKKFIDYDGALKFFDLMAEGAGLSITDGETLKSFAIKHHLLAASRSWAKNHVNLASTRWKVSGDGKVSVTDGNGTVIAEAPQGEGVIVLDPPSDLWDDTALCFEQCALEVAICKTERWYSYFRLGVITAVCVLESYVNRLAFAYLSRVSKPDESVQQEFSASGGHVSLREKVKKWPKLFAASAKPLEKDLWEDDFFDHLDKVIQIRDSFVHEKRPVHAVKSGPEGLAALKQVAEIVRAAIVRIGRAVAGQEPDWTRRHHEIFADPLQASHLRDEQDHANELGIAAGMSEQYNRARLFVIEAKEARDRPTRLRRLIAATYFAKALEEIMKEQAQQAGGETAKAEVSKWIQETAPYSHVLHKVRIHDFHRFGLTPLSDEDVAAYGPIKLSSGPGGTAKFVIPLNGEPPRVQTSGEQSKVEGVGAGGILAMRGEQVFDDRSNTWVQLAVVLEAFLRGIRVCAKELPERLKTLASAAKPAPNIKIQG